MMISSRTSLPGKSVRAMITESVMPSVSDTAVTAAASITADSRYW